MGRLLQLLVLVWIAFGVLCCSQMVIAQEYDGIRKSEITETIEGEIFHIHFVKAGETLYSIAKIYEVDVNTIFVHNATAREGIKIGQLLKIPMIDVQKAIGQSFAVADSAGFHYHIVQPKETFYGISKKYGTGIADIKKWNPGLEDYLKTGQVIIVPKTSATTQKETEPENGKYHLHVVAPGETLYSLSKQYDVTIGQIINANPAVADGLQAGQTLHIPVSQFFSEVEEEEQDIPEKDDGFIEYTIMAGETLYGIARSFGLPVDTLRKHNNNLTDQISVGQVILIPKTIDEVDYILHRTYEREKLESIAEKYGLEAGEIEEINPGVRKRVKSGQTVKIPVPPQELPEKEEMEKDTVAESYVSADPCADKFFYKERFFNVALMLPLYLEEYDSSLVRRDDLFDQKSLRSFRFIQFYEGFLIAADSLKKQGMNLNIFVYDVGHDIEKARRALRQSELTSMDLIIGPFFAGSFNEVEKFARTFDISIVNPFSARQDVAPGRPSVFKIQPSTLTPPRLIGDYILEKFENANVVIVKHNQYQHALEALEIKNYINKNREVGVYFRNDIIIEYLKKTLRQEQVYCENKLLKVSQLQDKPVDSLYFSNAVKEVIFSNDSLPGLRLTLSCLRHNVVIALTDEKVFAFEVMSRLNRIAGNREISLIGLPSWDQFEDMETAYVLNLNLHTVSPVHIDYSNDRTLQVVRKFRQNFSTEPVAELYAFDGFDTGWYFLNALYRYGKNFRFCLEHYSPDLIQTRYQFKKTENGGFENQYWNIVEYRDFLRKNAWKER